MITVLLIVASMVLVPWIVWRMLKLESWVPLPMFQIAAGILLGPSALGAFFPDLFATVFSAGVRASLDTIQTLAIVIFAFIGGLDLKPREVFAQ